MIRKIIKIDEDSCNGCGLCAEACHEGAIGMVDGKAVLLRDDYCDGLGDCLPSCPTGAISFEEREALPYDEAAVKSNMAKGQKGCPGSMAQTLKAMPQADSASAISGESELRQWPVQIQLAAANAAFFNGADLLIAADCAAYASGDFHSKFMKNRVTLIGCPKLDSVDYSQKLTDIIVNNDIRSITVVRMEVPCCSGIEQAASKALKNSGKLLPWQVVTLATNGSIIE